MRVKEALKAGVQTIQYQINTLMTTNGQSPFVTLFLYNGAVFKHIFYIYKTAVENRLQKVVRIVKMNCALFVRLGDMFGKQNTLRKVLGYLARNEVALCSRGAGADAQIEAIVDEIASRHRKRMLVEDIQDMVEEKLMELQKYQLMKSYILYRYERALIRKANTTR